MTAARWQSAIPPLPCPAHAPQVRAFLVVPLCPSSLLLSPRARSVRRGSGERPPLLAESASATAHAGVDTCTDTCTDIGRSHPLAWPVHSRRSVACQFKRPGFFPRSAPPHAMFSADKRVLSESVCSGLPVALSTCSSFAARKPAWQPPIEQMHTALLESAPRALRAS